jgi:hypothetical protein
MNLYKKFQPQETISKKSLDYLMVNNLIDNNNLFYSVIDQQEYFNAVPELLKFFQDLNLSCTRISLIKVFKNNVGIHTDNSPSHGATVRINIPVLNAEHSRTVFYENFNNQRTTKELKNGAIYHEFLDRDCKEIDSVCIDAPTAINVSVPHRVICKQFPRIALSCHVTPDPEHLLS